MLFTAVKAVDHFLPSVQIQGYVPLTILLLVSVGFGFKKVWKPSRIEIAIANSHTTIEVVFDDLFKQAGIRTIAVSQFFDTYLGKLVSDKSVHGIFIKQCFGGHSESLDKQLGDQLKGVASSEVQKVEGKTKSYAVGTTALITVNDDQYILFALTSADPQTLKASADVTMMWVALHEVWQRARIESGGRAVNLPLVGGGLSGLGLPTRDLLNLIILSAITETKAKEVTQRIRIVLTRDRFEDLDLREVAKHWRE